MISVLVRIDELSFDEVESLAARQAECRVVEHPGQNRNMEISTQFGTLEDIFALARMIGREEQKKRSEKNV